jgi:hypothetical protein
MKGEHVEFENERPFDVPSGEARSLFLVIPDSLNRESILVWFWMDPRYKLSGMTTDVLEVETTFSFYLAVSAN